MNKVSRGMMQALQRYTPEYKAQVLSRAERTWRPGELENEIDTLDTKKQHSQLQETPGQQD